MAAGDGEHEGALESRRGEDAESRRRTTRVARCHMSHVTRYTATTSRHVHDRTMIGHFSQAAAFLPVCDLLRMMHISGSAGGSIGTILTSLERIQTIFALDTVCVYPCTLYASMANAAPAIKYHESGVVELS